MMKIYLQVGKEKKELHDKRESVMKLEKGDRWPAAEDLTERAMAYDITVFGNAIIP